MSVIDLLITIIVVTILVTIALGVMSYLAYKLRLARQPRQTEEEGSESRYFVIHRPPAASVTAPEDTSVAET